jgi:hypothetical protein
MLSEHNDYSDYENRPMMALSTAADNVHAKFRKLFDKAMTAA